MYRTPRGATIKVTRTSLQKSSKGRYADEKYLGTVIRSADGGRVGPIVQAGRLSVEPQSKADNETGSTKAPKGPP